MIYIFFLKYIFQFVYKWSFFQGRTSTVEIQSENVQNYTFLVVQYCPKRCVLVPLSSNMYPFCEAVNLFIKLRYKDDKLYERVLPQAVLPLMVIFFLRLYYLIEHIWQWFSQQTGFHRKCANIWTVWVRRTLSRVSHSRVYGPWIILAV